MQSLLLARLIVILLLPMISLRRKPINQYDWANNYSFIPLCAYARFSKSDSSQILIFYSQIPINNLLTITTKQVAHILLFLWISPMSHVSCGHSANITITRCERVLKRKFGVCAYECTNQVSRKNPWFWFVIVFYRNKIFNFSKFQITLNFTVFSIPHSSGLLQPSALKCLRLFVHVKR
jgi:hypothetical protein